MRRILIASFLAAASVVTACQIVAGIDERVLGNRANGPNANGDAGTGEGGTTPPGTNGDGGVDNTCGVDGITCGTACVNPFTDNANCGTCGNVCAAGGACVAGYCVRPFYVSPTGSDANDGASEAKPWKTIDHALPLVTQGSGLVLLDGTYDPNGTGLFTADCNAGSHNGIAGGPLVVAAKNERMAKFASNGASPAITIQNCQWWVVRGLTATTSDFDNGGADVDTVVLANLNNVEVWRLLVQGNNRNTNGDGIHLSDYPNLLLAETEVYDVSTTALSAFDFSGKPTGLEIRGFYANARDRPDISGGPVTDPGGDAAFHIGNPVTIENAVVEDSNAGFYTGNDALVLGSIFLNITGNPIDIRGASRSTIRDTVILSSSLLYAEASSVEISNVTSFQSDGIRTRMTPGSITNSLSFGGLTSSTGFAADTPPSDFLTASSVGDSFVPDEPVGDDSGVYRQCSTTPATKIGGGPGNCVVYIPDGSSLKGAGAGGSDIGANVVHQYAKGVATAKKLWRPDGHLTTCGAVVPGINDVAGKSCIDVHERLGFTAGGCPVP